MPDAASQEEVKYRAVLLRYDQYVHLDGKATDGHYAIIDADVRCGSCGEAQWTFYETTVEKESDANDGASPEAEQEDQNEEEEQELICASCAGLDQ